MSWESWMTAEMSMSMVVAGDLGSADPNFSSLRLDGPTADWSQLPQSVLEEVVRRLPIPAQLRFRSVSKCWLELLTDPGFLRACVSSEPAPAAFLVLDILFKVLERAEHPYRLPTPGPLRIYNLPPLQGQMASVFQAVSHGGLVCLFSRHHRQLEWGARFLMFNPMTRASRMLPVGPAGTWTLALRVDGPFKAYTVLAVANNGEAIPRLHMYEASKDKWEDAGPVVPWLLPQQPVFCGEMVYFLGLGFHLVGWNLKSKEWESRSRNLPPPAEAESARLLSHRGELLLILLLARSFRSYGIWRLLPEGAWGQVALLSDSSFSEFFPKLAPCSRGLPWKAFSFGESQTVCLDIRVYEYVLPEEEETGKARRTHVERRVLLSFDFSIRAWFTMPLQFLIPFNAAGFWLPFQPRLDSMV